MIVSAATIVAAAVDDSFSSAAAAELLPFCNEDKVSTVITLTLSRSLVSLAAWRVAVSNNQMMQTANQQLQQHATVITRGDD